MELPTLHLYYEYQKDISRFNVLIFLHKPALLTTLFISVKSNFTLLVAQVKNLGIILVTISYGEERTCVKKECREKDVLMWGHQ